MPPHESVAACPYGPGAYHGPACDRCYDTDHCVDSGTCPCGCHGDGSYDGHGTGAGD